MNCILLTVSTALAQSQNKCISSAGFLETNWAKYFIAIVIPRAVPSISQSKLLTLLPTAHVENRHLQTFCVKLALHFFAAYCYTQYFQSVTVSIARRSRCGHECKSTVFFCFFFFTFFLKKGNTNCLRHNFGNIFFNNFVFFWFFVLFFIFWLFFHC